jgi:protein FrlC
VRISFNSWVYASFPVWLPSRSLDDVIDGLADIGYDGVEIGAAAPHGFPRHLDRSRRATIRARLEDRGMVVSALCPALGGAPGYNPVSVEAEERRASAEYLADCVDLAADLGCPHVIWLGGYRRHGQSADEAWAYAVESLTACARAARDRGVVLAVEPTPADSNVLEDAGDCLRILDDAGIGRETAGVMLDTFHILHRHDDLCDGFTLAGDRLVYVHLADAYRDPPGAHHDFGGVVDTLDRLGYDGWLSLEIGFDRRESDPDGLARAGFAHVRRAVDKTVSKRGQA